MCLTTQQSFASIGALYKLHYFSLDKTYSEATLLHSLGAINIRKNNSGNWRISINWGVEARNKRSDAQLHSEQSYVSFWPKAPHLAKKPLQVTPEPRELHSSLIPFEQLWNCAQTWPVLLLPLYALIQWNVFLFQHMESDDRVCVWKGVAYNQWWK